MQISLFAPDKEHIITHDLNFQQPRYESKHVIVSIIIIFFFFFRRRVVQRLTRALVSAIYRPSETPSLRSFRSSENLDPFPVTRMASSRNAVEL